MKLKDIKKEDLQKSFWVRTRKNPHYNEEPMEQLSYMIDCFIGEYEVNKISIGTYMPDALDISTILDEKNLIDIENHHLYSVRGICFERVTSEEWIDKYTRHDLLSNKNTCIGFVEKNDIKQCDVYPIQIDFEEFDEAWKIFTEID